MATEAEAPVTEQSEPPAQTSDGATAGCYSNPTHKLRNYLAEEKMIEIKVSGGENATDSKFYKVNPKIRQYKYGVAQPGVLCVKPDRTVLCSWAIDRSLMNLGGASDRPVPQDIWNIVQLKMSDNVDEEEVKRAYSRVRCHGATSTCTVL